MSRIVKAYQFVAKDPAVIDREPGSSPLLYVIPFGSEHTNEFEAEEWLKENHEDGEKYMLIPVYTFL